MMLMLELTRRCDIQCSHCLRGDAEGKDMPQNVMFHAFRKLEDIVDQIGFGGGESIMKPKLLQMFYQNLVYFDLKSEYFEPMWIVTNGKRLIRELEKWEDACGELDLEDEDYYDEKFGLIEKYCPILRYLIKISNRVPIDLAISTDKYHPNGKENLAVLEMYFSELYVEHQITLCEHGPRNSGVLIKMGRQETGRPVSLTENYLAYVTVNGDVYSSCDLSYKFMDNPKNSEVKIGNVLETSSVELIENLEKFHESEQKIEAVEEGVLI